MSSIKDAAGEFLPNRRIAVTSASRKPENHGIELDAHLLAPGHDISR